MAALLTLGAASGCASGRNYMPGAGALAQAQPPFGSPSLQPGDSLRIVSYNIEYARRVDEAIAVLRGSTALARADVLLLQEMTGPATAEIAAALGMAYVYFPTIYHHRQRRDVGNAILARWPMQDARQIILPHRSWYARTQRAATVATIVMPHRIIRVYSVHLGTVADISAGARRSQLAAVLQDASGAELALVGGDMNDYAVGHSASAFGFSWLTGHHGKSTRFGRLDHILSRGFTVPSPTDSVSGVVRPVIHASDHWPVWATVVVP